MKKQLLILFITVVGFNFSAAQEFHYGAKAGVNFSNLYSSNTPIEDVVKSRTSFHVGAISELRLSELFSLQLEALYSEQGAKAKNTYIPIDPPGEVGLTGTGSTSQVEPEVTEVQGAYNYLNLPFLAKFYIYKGLNLYAGPQFSILLSAKDSSGSAEVDVSDQIDPVDFGLIGGIGYQLEMGLFFNASYYWGINNISYIDYSDILGFDINIHQGVFHLSAGFKF